VVALAVGLLTGPAERHRPELSGRLLGWLIFVTVFAALNYSARFLLTDEEDRTEVAYQYSTSIATLIQYAFVLGILYFIVRDRYELLALRRPISWGTAAWVSVAIVVVLIAISSALSPFVDPEEEQGLIPSDWDSSRIAQFALFTATVTLVAPVVEELMFRGAGYSLLEPYGRVLAIVVVGVAFGLIHGLIEGLPVITAFGLGLTYLRSRTQSVYPCIVLHSIFNGAALAFGVTT
jgi:membrane protease YdiL (CAAX protease family)